MEQVDISTVPFREQVRPVTERIVVTGAFGYVGLALLARLSGKARVFAVGHPPRAAAPIPRDIEIVEGDLTLAADLLTPGAALVHLAGGGGERACLQDPAAAVRTITLGTSKLAAAARDARVRRSVYASTIAVYGTFQGRGRPLLESDHLQPDDFYGSLKAAAEHVFVAHARGVALRFANIYGAGCGVDLGQSGAIERFVRATVRSQDLSVFGDGLQRIDFVHVSDVVASIVCALEAADPPSVVNIGGGAPASILEIAQACVRAGQQHGACPRIVREPAPPGKLWPDRSLSIDLARKTLGWEPRIDLEQGIRELVTLRQSAA